MSLRQSISEWRINFLLLVVFLALAVLVGRVLLLQWFDVDRGYRFLQEQGEQRFVRTTTQNAPRGEIVDRHGSQLAISTPVYTLGAKPASLLADEEGLNGLALGLDMAPADLRKLLLRKRDKQFIYLRRHLSPQTTAELLAVGAKGVRAENAFRRFYPAGEVTAHLIGFNTITDEGQEGLELAFDDYLRPQLGSTKVIQDLHGDTVRELEQLQAAKPGNQLQLSIDLRTQYVAYTELAKAVTGAGAKYGSLVIADSRTGEVLALANYPSFNPNNRRGISYEFVRNRAIADAIEPGSTVKPFAVLAALEAGVVSENTVIDTAPGHIKVGGKVFQDSRSYGPLSVPEVLAKSSQVGITRLALAVDPFEMRNAYEQLGVGVAVGTGFPGEALGRLPSFAKWRDIDRATMSFGHGVSMSVLQLAQAYQILANDGVKAPLSLIKRDKPDFETVHNPQFVRTVRQMLAKTFETGGTASQSALDFYALAGKTGTVHKLGAEGYIEDKYRSLFAGFAPAEDPRFVAAIVIDDPSGSKYYGGEIAAPVFKAIAGIILPQMGITPGFSDIEIAGLSVASGVSL